MISQQNELPTRASVEDKYKWNLQDIYTSDEKWEEDYLWIKSQIPEFEKLKGKFTSSAKSLLNCFNFLNQVNSKLSRLYIYSSTSKDLDLSVGKYQIMYDKYKTRSLWQSY